jgi:hypothetical protein
MFHKDWFRLSKADIEGMHRRRDRMEIASLILFLQNKGSRIMNEAGTGLYYPFLGMEDNSCCC